MELRRACFVLFAAVLLMMTVVGLVTAIVVPPRVTVAHCVMPITHSGTASWSGDVLQSALTPPKKMARDDFAARLVEGLKGVSVAAEDVFELEVLPEGRRRLCWSVVKRGLVDVKLEHAATLLLEGSPGAGLRALLLGLADESAALHDECRAQTSKAAGFVVEHAELDGVAARQPEYACRCVLCSFESHGCEKKGVGPGFSSVIGTRGNPGRLRRS